MRGRSRGRGLTGKGVGNITSRGRGPVGSGSFRVPDTLSRHPVPGDRLRTSGFTLLEVLLATVLIGAIVGVVYEMYLGSLRSARRGVSEMACYQAGRAILQMITDDLRSAVLTGGLFGFGLIGTDGDDELASDELELSCFSAVRWRAEPEGFAADPLPPVADVREITSSFTRSGSKASPATSSSKVLNSARSPRVRPITSSRASRSVWRP